MLAFIYNKNINRETKKWARSCSSSRILRKTVMFMNLIKFFVFLANIACVLFRLFFNWSFSVRAVFFASGYILVTNGYLYILQKKKNFLTFQYRKKKSVMMTISLVHFSVFPLIAILSFTSGRIPVSYYKQTFLKKKNVLKYAISWNVHEVDLSIRYFYVLSFLHTAAAMLWSSIIEKPNLLVFKKHSKLYDLTL